MLFSSRHSRQKISLKDKDLNLSEVDSSLPAPTIQCYAELLYWVLAEKQWAWTWITLHRITLPVPLPNPIFSFSNLRPHSSLEKSFFGGGFIYLVFFWHPKSISCMLLLIKKARWKVEILGNGGHDVTWNQQTRFFYLAICALEATKF